MKDIWHWIDTSGIHVLTYEFNSKFNHHLNYKILFHIFGLRNRFSYGSKIIQTITISKNDNSIASIKLIGRQHSSLTDVVDHINFCYAYLVRLTWDMRLKTKLEVHHLLHLNQCQCQFQWLDDFQHRNCIWKNRYSFVQSP